jgi:hypothetical protein
MEKEKVREEGKRAGRERERGYCITSVFVYLMDSESPLQSSHSIASIEHPGIRHCKPSKQSDSWAKLMKMLKLTHVAKKETINFFSPL